jgi:hypothetical protein
MADEHETRGELEPTGAAPPVEPEREARDERSPFLPNRATRLRVESFAMRLVATAGIVGIGTALGAILGTQDVKAWIIALVVSTVSVLLAGVLWSSRSL